MNKNVSNVLIICMSVYLFSQGAVAMLDPSASYCTSLGYTFNVKTSADGETGYCMLPNNQEVDSWDFLRGSVATQYSGCTKLGYTLKIVTDSTKCSHIYSDSCSVCVLEGGKEIEVTQLMNLSFNEPQMIIEKPVTTTNSTSTRSPGFSSLTAFIGLCTGSILAMLFLNREKIKG